ncbi:MAG: NAD+ synthase [Candidatus Aenigmarchaeota archaeon]|nr:NAD+ synthase [Candidatus Aenigmarchaeota archaeon]
MEIDCGKVEKKIVRWIKEKMKESGRKKLIVGMSGGIDSSLVAYLCSKAAKPKNVHGYFLPYDKTLKDKDLEDAKSLTKNLGINFEIINITDVVELLRNKLGKMSRVTFGNMQARIRMVILYQRANQLDGLVVGTGNKSEWLTGYFTKYGDGAADIYPIIGLYKTQVRMLARHVGLPEQIIDKVPSPGLWKGHTDEGELGVKYEELDKFLFYWYDKKLSITQAAKKAGISVEKAKHIIKMVEKNFHKRLTERNMLLDLNV